MPATSGRSFAWLLAAAALVTGVAWTIVVPPFESPDESLFYKSLMREASGGAAMSLPLYGAVMKPVLRLAGRESRPFQIHYNPSFRFVSNRYGRVNMFMHGRSEGAVRGDIRRMYVLRAATMAMWSVALLLIFETARLVFGRGDLALLVAVLALSVPQFSFFATKIHPEATCGLLGAIVYLALTARAFGRAGRVATWIVCLAAMALAPFSDRQGFFLLLLAPFGLLVTEKSWRGAAVVVAALMVPAALLLLLPQFSRLQTEFWVTFVGSYTPSYNRGWWNAWNGRMFVFEVIPKLFFSFWGWLGQPSILLPPAIYATFAVVTLLALAGLCLRRVPLTPEQRRAAWIFGVGVCLTLAPILYANLFISRNSWHGRWLFPSMAPIMIAIVGGVRAFAAFARRHPRATAIALVITAAILELLWMASPGDAVRADIASAHYGDRPHFIATIGLTIAALGIAGGLAAMASLIGRPLAGPRASLWVAGAAWTANLVLLFTFVAPLYAPLDAAGFVAVVQAEAAEGEYGRASALYRLGVAAYPDSTRLRRLADEIPMVMLAGNDDQLIAQLQGRIARGDTLGTRQELMALARAVRTKEWLEPAALAAVLDLHDVDGAGAPSAADLAEPALLLRTQVEGRTQEPSSAAAVVRAGGGRLTPADMEGHASLVGYTLHPAAAGQSQVTVYFRPERGWTGHRLWMHAYPDGSDSYIIVDPAPPAFDSWRAGEMAWESFLVPANVRLNVYVGAVIGERLGPGYPLGPIPHD